MKTECHMTRCKKRRERQTKKHNVEVVQQKKLEEDARKARTLNLWGDQLRKTTTK